MARRIDVMRIETGPSRGTGFLIDHERVLTALHVVGTVERGRLVFHGQNLSITAAVQDGVSFRFPVCAPAVADVQFDERLDWACIKVDGAFSSVGPLAVGELGDSDHSAAWHTYGFPDSSPDDG
ncbi:MAG TPA: trypsin-like peptidase domain-containing protein, partial [Polyangiaceae bacterium]|nr:trypsin-like peptidase domain-containing protein [Polyangiaceae bacterium]